MTPSPDTVSEKAAREFVEKWMAGEGLTHMVGKSCLIHRLSAVFTELASAVQQRDELREHVLGCGRLKAALKSFAIAVAYEGEGNWIVSACGQHASGETLTSAIAMLEDTLQAVRDFIGGMPDEKLVPNMRTVRDLLCDTIPATPGSGPAK